MKGKNPLIKRYRLIAPFYDILIHLYYLIGFRGMAYRREAVRALSLREGSLVVEVGCGTGNNFSLLQREVGPKGRIIGVDISSSMLDRARKRVERSGWNNVALIECDGDHYEFPPGTEGILFSFSFRHISNPESTIKRAAASLSPWGHLVILDIKTPSTLPPPIGKKLIGLAAPFSLGKVAEWHNPSEAAGDLMAEHTLREYYLGSTYIYSGRAKGTLADNSSQVISQKGGGRLDRL
jgi:demethylmenaquinone methyltransferase/2-methoxy-6-polyprenyl-1,4-benzoquinol methylase